MPPRAPLRQRIGAVTVAVTVASWVLPVVGGFGVASRAAAQASGAQAAPAAASPIVVKVEQRGELVIVDVDVTVAAPRELVFNVLTDFEHMPSFLSTLKTSAVLSRLGNVLEVEQSGEARHGLLRFPFHTLRQIEEVPNAEIRSHLIKGDFKSYELVTRLADEGGNTVVHQHGEYVPNAWIPPGIGPAAIKAETERGYGEFIAEILKRRGVQKP